MDQLTERLQAGVNELTRILDHLNQEVATLRGNWTGSATDAYDRAQRQWTAQLREMNELLAQHRGTAHHAQEIFRDARRRNAEIWS